MSEAKSTRRRRGLPDKAVDPELSAKRRLAALARWHGGDANAVASPADTPAAARHRERARALDRSVVHHLHKRLTDGRTTAYEVLAGTQAEMVKIILGIARDAREPGKTRLHAAELVLQLAATAAEITKPAREAFEVDGEDLDAMIADLRTLRAKKLALEHRPAIDVTAPS